MSMLRFLAKILILACLFPCLAPLTSAAQDQSPADSDGALGFDEVYGQWTKINDRVDAVIKEYRIASSTNRVKLLEEYNGLIAQSREVLPRLRVAALASYKAEPNQDDRVTKALVGMVKNDVHQDEYEAALELAKTLLDNDCDEPALNTFVGIAAYCVDDFATAEIHLKRAEAANVLTADAETCLSDLDTAIKAWAVEQPIRAQEAEADDLPRVKMETTNGTVVIELYENEAPGAVGNFVSLVESKYYDGLTFHRVLRGFMAQGGCPVGTGGGGPGYEIPCECYQKNHRNHFRGSLSMAHSGLDTGGSQFFLTFKRTAHLDGKHTVFGRVIEGLDVLAKIQRRNPQQRGEIPAPDKVVKAEVVRKRDHEYKPTKVAESE